MVKAIVFDWIDTLFERDNALFPNSKQVLEECKKRGFKLALITKAGGDSPEVRWKQINKANFNGVFDLAYVGLDKDEATYAEVINVLGADPKKTWVVGDQVRKDIRIGNNLGCKTVWIRAGGRHNDRMPKEAVEEPHHTIRSIEEVLKLV
ncbi:MAG: HAD hydrolase-like protein [Candidatus Diapherotrites archaeon]|nr:HAD hydrolase-like protein [Candidatus Diapherotrites archaeon]